MRSASDTTNIWWTTSVDYGSVMRSGSPCRRPPCISIRLAIRPKTKLVQLVKYRHPRGSGGPGQTQRLGGFWIPAFAGMTDNVLLLPNSVCVRLHSVNPREAVMQRISIVFAILAALGLSLPAMAQQAVTLNVVTAGDQNMVDYVKDYWDRCSRRNTRVSRSGQSAPDPAMPARKRSTRNSKPRRAAPPGTSTSRSSTRKQPARWSAKGC